MKKKKIKNRGIYIHFCFISNSTLILSALPNSLRNILRSSMFSSDAKLISNVKFRGSLSLFWNRYDICALRAPVIIDSYPLLDSMCILHLPSESLGLHPSSTNLWANISAIAFLSTNGVFGVMLYLQNDSIYGVSLRRLVKNEISTKGGDSGLEYLFPILLIDIKINDRHSYTIFLISLMHTHH